jgi:Cu-Zn family superoxide dismutase
MKSMIVAVATVLAATPLFALDVVAIASATLKNAEGSTVGEVVLHETPQGVLVRARFTDLPAGTHGFHIHQTGKCEPPFESAGGHFNPTDASHGFKSENGMHAGDMPNLVVPKSGEIEIDYFLEGVRVNDGSKGVLDQDGASVVVHAKADDYHTDPAGSAGDRIACGVLEKKTGTVSSK